MGLGALVGLVACTGAIDRPFAANADDWTVSTPPPAMAPLPDDGLSAGEKQFAATVAPLLARQCAGCHGDGRSAPPWFGVEDVSYTRMRQWQTVGAGALVRFGDPVGSALLNYGAHTGPALSDADAEVIRAWMQTEAEAGAAAAEAGGGAVATTPLSVAQDGTVNVIALTELGLPGASISFRIQRDPQNPAAATFTEMRLNAGAQALRVRAPRIVTCVGLACTADPADSIFINSVVVGAGTSLPLGSGGLVILTGFGPDDLLSFAFDNIAPQ